MGKRLLARARGGVEKQGSRICRSGKDCCSAIAVYDVPGINVNQKALIKELSKEAYLKRDGKKDLRPVGVNLLPQEGGLTTIVYLFPRSEEITAEDKRVEFAAVFGRLGLAEYFYPAQMRFQGKLELIDSVGTNI